MSKINRLLLEVCKYLIIVMTVTTFIQVIMRYVFVAPLTWPDELGRYLLVWSCCLGSAYAMKDGLHVSLNYVKNKISGHDQNVFVVLVHLTLLAFFFVCSNEGYQYAVNIVGFVRGGLALANVVASMLFGGITGAATADASALGSVEIPMMVRSGYDAKFSAAVTAASSCIGPIIPPSVVVVIYAMAVRGVSIGGMFAAGIIPGILVGVALMVTCYIISVRRQYPKHKNIAWPGKKLNKMALKQEIEKGLSS
jgi:TRAP-type C4-dicarboxylate transport system permease small subunit